MPKYSLDTKIKVLLLDEEAKKIVTDAFGTDILKSPLVSMAKMFSVKGALKYRYKLDDSDQSKLDEALSQIMALE